MNTPRISSPSKVSRPKKGDSLGLAKGSVPDFPRHESSDPPCGLQVTPVLERNQIPAPRSTEMCRTAHQLERRRPPLRCHKMSKLHARFIVALLASWAICISTSFPVWAVDSRPDREQCESAARQADVYMRKSETWAWLEICRGRTANFNRGLEIKPDPKDPSHDTRWKDSVRRLDPDFLRTILAQEPFRTMIQGRKARIVGGYFPAGIDLSDVSIRNELEIDKSFVKSGIEMERTVTSRSISFNRVRVKGKLDMDFLSAGASVVIKNALVDRLSLRKADIGGWLDLRSSTFLKKVDMGSLTVDGDLNVNGATFSEIILRRATVSGELDMKGANVTGYLDAERATIQSAMILKSTQLCSRARFNHVNVGTELDMRISHIGTLDLTGARVGEALILGSPSDTGEFVRCPADDTKVLAGKVVLQDTEVGLLKDTKNAWPTYLDRELDGFKYARLEEIKADDGGTPYHRGAQWFIQWLATDKTYTPRPYIQLARVMEASGQGDMASEILFARWERRRLESDTSQFRWWLLTALRYTMGYGQGWGNFLALAWVAGFSLLGAVVVRLTGEKGTDKKPLGFWYSLDMLLPVAQLHGPHYEIHLETAAKYYFMVHKLAGYVLVFLVISGITTVLTEVIE